MNICRNSISIPIRQQCWVSFWVDSCTSGGGHGSVSIFITFTIRVYVSERWISVRVFCTTTRKRIVLWNSRCTPMTQRRLSRGGRRENQTFNAAKLAGRAGLRHEKSCQTVRREIKNVEKKYSISNRSVRDSVKTTEPTTSRC